MADKPPFTPAEVVALADAVTRVRQISDGAMAAFRYLAEVASDESAPRRHRLRAAIGLADRCPPEIIRTLRHKAPTP
jgi:hypothetical protein